MELNKIYLADCLEVMKQIPLDNIDLILTDPPYNVGYHYKAKDDNRTLEEYQEFFKPMIGKPTVIIHYPENIISDIVPILGNPEKCVSWVYNSNLPRQHRMIAWFNCKPDFSKAKQPYKNLEDKRIKENGSSDGARLYDWWEIQQVKNISSDKLNHPCMIPLLVKKRIIQITTNEGDTILDPFAGSGTTAIACHDLKRNFICIEKEPEYHAIATKRYNEAKAQMTLF